MRLPANLHIGPAHWARRKGCGLVSPAAGHRGVHILEHLAAFVNLAQIDSTFHAPLRPEIASLYTNKVAGNRDFQFAARLGRRFTYDRDLSAESVAAWKKGFFPLRRCGRLGALILEFPWGFRFNAENREFLIQLGRAFREFPLAAEFRHESWLAEEGISTLIDYHFSLVNIDQPAYFRAMPRSALLTAGVAVVRLHGRAGAEAFRDFEEAAADSPYLYSTDELEEWLAGIRRLAANSPRTLVIFSNAGQGNALVNALQLGEMMGAEDLLAPADIIGRHPGALAAFHASRPVQPFLLSALADDGTRPKRVA